jgi:methylenetetrahydrofolate reductase (NADPH)
MNRKITEILNTKKRTISAEIIPPRNGTETEKSFLQIQTLKDAKIDFISVTKGAGGSLRGGTLPIAHMIQSQHHIPSVAHFTCRDHSIEEIENLLMDHHYFGVKNILALRGDPPDGQPDYFKNEPGRHIFAYQLVKQIHQLNKGEYLIRKGFDHDSKTSLRSGAKTDFCIGVAAHPEFIPLEKSIEYLKLKTEMGAEFGITQMIYNLDVLEKFLNAMEKNKIKIPILPGFRILTNAQSAARMGNKFGVNIPKTLIDRLSEAKNDEEGKKIGVEYFTEYCNQLFRLGIKGIHLFVMNDAITAKTLAEQLS